MGRKLVLTDDLDGKELPEDTRPTMLSVGSKSWNLYLSADSVDKLHKAVEKFTKNAEPTASRATAPASRATKAADKERTKAVRAWAQAEKVTQPSGKPVGDRGRIPQEVYDAYDKAHS